MNWAGKLRPQGAAPAMGAAKSSVASATAAAPANPNVRVSNSLKEFLWLLGDIPHARILDLGAVSQHTINFFIQKGFKLTTEDLLRAWKDFLATEEERLRSSPPEESYEELTAAALADRFLKTELQYGDESLNGVVIWDLFDYFDITAAPKFVERLYKMLRPGGAMLCLFHSRPPAAFHRYRILEGNNVEQVPAPTLAVHSHVFQNREIQDLFRQFRSSKTFVGRDQVREALFLK